jgi:DNA-binding response OmpR family regulator
MILLVEDDPDHEALTIRALRKNNVGNEIVVAHDGAEAIEFLFGSGRYASRDPRETPQVVILDLKLPKVDGFEVLRRMRSEELTRLTPVVILTSSDEERDMVEGYSLGANSYVRKPVDFLEFVEATRQLGLYWLVLNDVPRGIGRVR